VDDSRDLLSEAALRHYVADVCSDAYIDELLAVVREHVDDDLPHYSDALRVAFADVEPVFTRRRYAEFFWQCATRVPGYVPRVILANGPAEGEGSQKLFELWRSVHSNREVEHGVLKHAVDESRHSRLFVRLTEAAFPEFLSEEAGARFEATLPDIRRKPRVKAPMPIPTDHVIDHLVQMNIGEIRTRLHMHLFAPIVFGLTPRDDRTKTRRILDVLVRDEVRHIGYTAVLMEAWARDGADDLIKRLYAGRLRTFNRITVEQTEEAVRKYGRGAFPDLLEI
jgi:hypothetical protein